MQLLAAPVSYRVFICTLGETATGNVVPVHLPKVRIQMIKMITTTMTTF